MIYFYRILWIILLPIVTLWFIFRLIKGKEDGSRIKERFGFTGVKRPKRKLVWFHAASVGESLSILPLIETLLTKYKALNILVTTGTVTSAKMMANRLPEGVIHQYIPVDFYLTVRHFMKHWHPDLSVFVESELWPELCAKAPNPILINGRIGHKSAKRYKKLKGLTGTLFSRFKLALMQTGLDAERLNSFSKIPTSVSGNLKFDAKKPPFDQTLLANFSKALQGKRILIAASTHPEEEVIIASMAFQIKREVPNLQTIIIPRHPERGKSIQAELSKHHIKSTLRSKEEAISDIYIADTLGEMGLWYALADMVLMGGSLVPHGGQNPYEPLKFSKVTLCGPYMFNFKEMMDIFKERDIILQEETIEDLEKELVYFLKNDKNRAVTEKHIQENMQGLGGATTFTADKIIDLLQNNA